LKDKKLTFSIDNYTLKEISDSQLMVLEMYVARSGQNKHGLPISRDAIIDSAETLIGKPILYKFNKNTQDVMGHEVDEIACGVCGFSDDDYYFKEDDGELWLVCKAYIWKMYFEDVVNIFERDKEKAISMEMLLVDSEVEEDKETLIKSFCFTGVTLLGAEYNPAIPKANAEVIKYSDINFKSLVEETRELLFAKNSDKEVNPLKKFNKEEFAQKFSLTANQMFEMFEKEIGKLKCKMGSGEEMYECKKYYIRDFCGSFVYARDIEEETMVAIPYKYAEMKPELDMGNIRFARVGYEVMEKDMPKEDDLIKTFEEKAVKKAIETINSENEKKVKEFETKIEELENEKNTLTESKVEFEEKIKTLETEKNELVTFKENIEKQQKEQEINFAIESVKDSLNEAQIKEWSDKVDAYESIEQFKNAIQAFAYTQVKNVKPKDEEDRIHIPQNNDENTKKGLWD